MTILTITGTNTDVGKTIVVAALAVHARQEGIDVLPIKPVQTGEPTGSGDATTIERLTGIKALDFARYPEPLAPNLSARRAGITAATVEEIAAFIREHDRPDRLLLVEGAGGLLVRLNDKASFADLIVALDAPTIVVTSMGLGSLNLAELTCEAARNRGIEVLGLIGGSINANPDLATRLNVEEMPILCQCPLWGVFPENSGTLSSEAFSNMVHELGLPRLSHFVDN